MTWASASAPIQVEPDLPFSRVLREATTESHSVAEGAGYLNALLGGRLDATQYSLMVAQHWFIYAELESVGRAMLTDPVAGSFVDDALLRTASLESDLVDLLGQDWPDAVDALPATVEYVERLRLVGGSTSHGFVAHHYTRYLGDLSGGQFIGRALRGVFNFGGDAATAFYTFAELGDLGAYKDAYRARLDSAPWSDEQRSEVITETLEAYRLNSAVFADLAAAVR